MNSTGNQASRPLEAPAYVITGSGRNVGWRWVDDDQDDADG